MFRQRTEPVAYTIPTKRIKFPVNFNAKRPKRQYLIVLLFISVRMISMTVWFIYRIQIAICFTDKNRKFFKFISILCKKAMDIWRIYKSTRFIGKRCNLSNITPYCLNIEKIGETIDIKQLYREVVFFLSSVINPIHHLHSLIS